MPQTTPTLGLIDIDLFAANIWSGTEKNLVPLKLTLMAPATSFNNTFVAGLASKTYFAVKLQLVGWKNITNT